MKDIESLYQSENKKDWLKGMLLQKELEFDEFEVPIEENLVRYCYAIMEEKKNQIENKHYFLIDSVYRMKKKHNFKFQNESHYYRWTGSFLHQAKIFDQNNIKTIIESLIGSPEE